MKKNPSPWTILRFVLCLFLCQCVRDLPAQVHLQWSKKVGSSQRNEVPAAIIPVGQHYVVGGFSEHPKTQYRQANLLKINLRGDTLWVQNYAEKKQHCRISHLLATQDGHIAAAGYCQGDDNRKRILLLKIDGETGAIHWKYELPSDKSLMPQALIETTAGELWIIYNTEKIAAAKSSTPAALHIGWSKISAKGQFLTEEQLTRPYDESIVSVCPHPQGFLLLSNVSDYLNNRDYYRIYQLQESGAIQQHYDLDWLPYQSATLTDLDCNAQGTIALIGNVTLPDKKQPTRNTEPKVWLLDTQGTLLWQQSIRITDHFVRIESLELEADGSVLVVGHSVDLPHEQEESSNVWIGKMNAQGQLLWWQEYGSDYEDKGIAVTSGGRGEWIVVGTSFYTNYNKKDSYILQLIEETKDLRRITPKVWALVVGIDRYASSLTLRPLTAASNDASSLYNFLRSQQGGALPDAQISLLLNEQATTSNILAAARRLFLQASPYDMIVFYFAGHGAPQAFWGYDGKIPHSSLNTLLLHSPAMKRVCIADACFSGTWTAKSADVTETQLPPQERYYEALRQSGDGLVLFLSTDADEESYETNGQGFFTYFFIEGLKGNADSNKNQLITIEELYNYVSEQVSREVSLHQLQQHPRLYGVFDKNMPMGVVGE